jgi:hypothetical protein
VYKASGYHWLSGARPAGFPILQPSDWARPGGYWIFIDCIVKNKLCIDHAMIALKASMEKGNLRHEAERSVEIRC